MSNSFVHNRYESVEGRTKILIVEDDDDFATDFEEMARNLGGKSFDMLRATSVEEGISSVDSLGDELPDIAIVDVGLEDSNGLDFVRWARDNQLPFPIIVVSQNELDEVQYDGKAVSLPVLKELGATEFQSKSTISASYPDFVKFIFAVRMEFERMLDIADRPDKVFHSTLSRDTITDLTMALKICRPSAISGVASQEFLSRDKREMIALYLESAINKEQLRLRYTLELSIRDKIRAFSGAVATSSSEEKEKSGGGESKLARFSHAVSRLWSPSRLP